MTSVFFQQSDYQEEQLLLEDLIEEAISIHGIDCFYLPRKTYDVDEVLSEDAQHYFDEALPFDAYLKNADHFGGAGSYLSQFGIEIRDRIELTISRRHWARVVGDERGLPRPREGDYVYMNVNKRLFEVREVERFEMTYPLGALPVWEMECELVEASSVRIETGIEAIDAFEVETTQDLFRVATLTADGAIIRTADGQVWASDAEEETIDPLDETEAIQRDAEEIIDFSEQDIFDDA